MEEWKEYTLGEIANIQTGPFGTLLHTYDYCDDGIPVIMPKDIQNNKIIDKDLLFVGEKKAYELNRFRAHEGDLLVARKGDVSKLALVDKKHDDVLCGSDCILIKMPKNISSSFLNPPKVMFVFPMSNANNIIHTSLFYFLYFTTHGAKIKVLFLF